MQTGFYRFGPPLSRRDAEPSPARPGARVMQADWRRQALELPSVGEISLKAVRAAYWRLIGAGGEIDKTRIRQARQQLLFELGQRTPCRGNAAGGDNSSKNSADGQ